jgi:MFS family permease
MHKLHYGWVVVAVGALTTCLAVGAMLALPVFLAPISAETGWSRGGIAFAITLSFLVMGAASFVWGHLSDRYGPRPVVLTGVVLLGIGYAWTSRATSLIEFQLVYGGLVGTAAGSFMAPLISTVTIWFDRHRALAVSLVSSGVGVAPMTISPIAAWLLAAHGWRTAQLILAVAIVVVLLPAAWLVRRPADVAAPDTGTKAGEHAFRQQAAQALRSRPFAILALVFFACCATHAGPIFHTVSYALGCGLSTMAAVTIYSVEGFAGLVGRLLFGMLADRVGVKRMIIAGLLIQALGAGAYAAVSRLGEFYAVAFVFGMAYGGVMPLYAALARAYFKPQIMGTVLGGLTFASGIGMAFGPFAGGWLYDHYQAYTWMYIGSLVVGLAAAGVAFALPRPRPVYSTGGAVMAA